jgi:hypothetical protein
MRFNPIRGLEQFSKAGNNGHHRLPSPSALISDPSGKNLTFGTLMERPKPNETQRNSGLFTVPSVAFLPLVPARAASG